MRRVVAKERVEERCCGECCHFLYEGIDGWGICHIQDDCNSMHCSDLCTTDKFVSSDEMRHHLAMLRKCQRCLSKNVGTIHDLDVKSISEAIDFLVEYSKLY